MSQRGVPTYYLTNFSLKLHENEDSLVQKAVPWAILDPSLQDTQGSGGSKGIPTIISSFSCSFREKFIK